MSGAPMCHALWVGSGLGALERACLRSFVDAGHPVTLWCYGACDGVPHGVTRADASQVLDPGLIVRHRATGSVSLFSNRFRYELLRRGRGPWIDCDVLCLRPLPPAERLFGFERPGRVNGAVLALPAHDAVLQDLLAIFERRAWLPPWASLRRRLRWSMRRMLRPDHGLGDLPWGTTGPDALTWYLARHGLTQHALAPEVLYPIGPHETDLLLAPDASAALARIGPRTHTVHLWHQALVAGAGAPPPTSFLGQVLAGRWPALHRTLARAPARDGV